MLKGKTVHHATFGGGTIVEVKEDMAYVQFKGAGGRGATRKFLMDALFKDELFPHKLNAEIWKLRGLDAYKRSTRLTQKPLSQAMSEAIDLAHVPTQPRRPKS